MPTVHPIKPSPTPAPLPTVDPVLPSNPSPEPMPSVKPTVPSTPKPTSPVVTPPVVETPKPTTPAVTPTVKPSTPSPAPAPSDKPSSPAETPKPAPAPADTPDPVPPVTPVPAPSPSTTLPAVIPPESLPVITPSPIPEETVPVVVPPTAEVTPGVIPTPTPTPCVSALPGLGAVVGDKVTTTGKAKAKAVDTDTDNATPCGLTALETPSLQTPGLTFPVTELSAPLAGTKHLPLMKAPKLGPQLTGGKVTVTQDGNVLTAAVTGFDPEPTSLDYQWFANDDLVPGATDATFDAGTIEAGDNFAVRVIAHRAGYTDRLIAGYYNLDLPTGLVRR
jgi:hypothetical protein